MTYDKLTMELPDIINKKNCKISDFFIENKEDNLLIVSHKRKIRYKDQQIKKMMLFYKKDFFVFKPYLQQNIFLKLFDFFCGKQWELIDFFSKVSGEWLEINSGMTNTYIGSGIEYHNKSYVEGKWEEPIPIYKLWIKKIKRGL